jgi:bacterioferritin (cytochrome b1)
MAKPRSNEDEQKVSRDRLAELLNEDLSREYQAIISYVVYSQVLKGAEFMSIAEQLEVHAQQELKHALIISKQIDYLGKMPTVTPKPVRTSEKAKDMLRFDLDNENETIKTTARGFGNVRRSANLPWPNFFGRFSWMSWTTKSTWRRRSVWKFRMSPRLSLRANVPQCRLAILPGEQPSQSRRTPDHGEKLSPGTMSD